ncbi:hypothetical protein BCL57_001464 [Agromyces flavus]|uniref:Uncharacterized protein n=1 Tax=Agromyces flavus TaxID=589382 RepID=A0A1H1ZWY9_9MICO|nr:hypothetical protein [Agromyces flavus]MCP2367310.1 hypothetical protein [Agromyces flavus]GGI45983.1 hypothetical protein GCM10010932_12310 [Agromyces flavus]SDT38087.1 hypothetical protein SAMN04489721_3388 [Agromyces flavus]
MDVLLTTLSALGLSALAAAMLFALAAVNGTPLIHRRRAAGGTESLPVDDAERRPPRHRA